ncbi:MAG TPA: alpha-hydroxy-acid oxidizing protein [Solirubrobacteraceae bacterium]|nr:alpha-hydroxy-acid oxidizing protein [Solirubrobacteraceae bacterium]
MNGRERQTQIYRDGVSGMRPPIPLDADRLEAAARRRMKPHAYAYVAAGAGNERTVAANRAAFDRWRIVPRMLRDVEHRDTSIELFGQRLSSPFLLAPVGALEIVHPEAESAVACAARDAGAAMVFSNQASRPMEGVANILGDTPHWFQLYWSRSDDLVASLVGRAERCGCRAIVITLDTTMLGWRSRDLEGGYLPFLHGKGLAQYMSDPVFRRLLGEPSSATKREQPKPTLAALRTLMEVTRAYPDNFFRTLISGRGRTAIERFTEIYSRPSLTWETLAFLRERTDLPILLKGILHPDDAVRAVTEGMNGVIVSNHGGRQVDGSIATLDALPGVVEAVDGRIPVLLDSGVRGGADIFKALALGARAVLIGRPYAYALAIAGRTGVRELLLNLAADFDLTMGLTGCRSVAEIGPEAVVPAPGALGELRAPTLAVPDAPAV